jgi:hypothetical protein
MLDDSFHDRITTEYICTEITNAIQRISQESRNVKKVAVKSFEPVRLKTQRGDDRYYSNI